MPGGRNWFVSFILGKEENLPIVKPYGLGFWKDRIYVCDTTIPALVVIDLKQKRFTYLASAAAARLSKPINIAIDEDGTKYVADTVRGVLVFDADDRYVGELQAEDGMKPSDIAISGNRLYIADLKNSRIVVLDKNTRRQVLTIPREGEISQQARLYSPVNLAVDRRGNLYVSDMGAFRVLEYDRDGRYLQSFGSPGDAPGQFARPKGIDLDDAGLLYAVDAAAQAVQIFDPEGRLLLYFGEPRESGMPLSLPATVRLNKTLIPYFRDLADPSFDVEYLAFVSSQYGDHKISVFGVGRR
jgi:streptogramin lyase